MTARRDQLSAEKRHLLLGGVLFPAAVLSLAMLPHAVGMVILHCKRDSYQPVVCKVLHKERGRSRSGAYESLEIRPPAATLSESVRVSPEIYQRARVGEEMTFRYNPHGSPVLIQGSAMRAVAAETWPTPYRVYRMIAWYLLLVFAVIWWIRRYQQIPTEEHRRARERTEKM